MSECDRIPKSISKPHKEDRYGKIWPPSETGLLPMSGKGPGNSDENAEWRHGVAKADTLSFLSAIR
jgi:hypothetical protein